MSPLDVLDDLRTASPVAPPELRERVRAIAAGVPAPRPRVTWRRAALVLVPVVLAAAVGAAVLGRGDRSAAPEHGGADRAAATGATLKAAPSGVPAAGPRLQDYEATLSLHVRDATAISDATKQALRIAASLGGFPAAVSVDVHGDGGSATLRLRVPATKVQTAVRRLSALGTITGEDVAVRDVQAGVDELDRTIARLQRQLRQLRATGAAQRQIDALTARIERLQRARADAVRRARLATIELHLTTQRPAAAPERHGPLHGAVTALRRLGIGALYALVVGGPVVLLAAAAWLAWRRLRRRADARLLGV